LLKALVPKALVLKALVLNSTFLFQFLKTLILNSNSLLGLGEAEPPLESQGVAGLLKGAYSANNLQLLFNL
jgi:hypothetical protein